MGSLSLTLLCHVNSTKDLTHPITNSMELP
jgi:hypothetical protein